MSLGLRGTNLTLMGTGAAYKAHLLVVQAHLLVVLILVVQATQLKSASVELAPQESNALQDQQRMQPPNPGH